MTWTNLARSELRKLFTTRMPLAFVAVLALLAVINGIAVVIGTDMDGSKTFISTGPDQQSLVAFAANSIMITGLFGAIAAAREYGHNTVIATFLAAPRRSRALSSQFAAIGVGGAVLGFLGALFTVVAVAATLPTTDFGFLIPASGVAQVLTSSTFAGAAGAVLGAAVGSVVRNTGGAVTVTVIALIIAPPLVIQLASGTAPWFPGFLAATASGISSETSVTAAIGALVLWALVPALFALETIRRRDVV